MTREIDHMSVLVDADPSTGRYWATYHYPSQPPSMSVALALMEITDSSVTDLPAMHDTASVNVEALDDLFDPTLNGDCCEGCLTFTYHDYRVMVKNHGPIIIQS